MPWLGVKEQQLREPVRLLGVTQARLETTMPQLGALLYFADGADLLLLSGYGSYAESYLETSLGQFNTRRAGNATSWVDTDRLFVIGNGDRLLRSLRRPSDPQKWEHDLNGNSHCERELPSHGHLGRQQWKYRYTGPSAHQHHYRYCVGGCFNKYR